jgi:hypothetical protein
MSATTLNKNPTAEEIINRHPLQATESRSSPPALFIYIF